MRGRLRRYHLLIAIRSATPFCRHICFQRRLLLDSQQRLNHDAIFAADTTFKLCVRLLPLSDELLDGTDATWETYSDASGRLALLEARLGRVLPLVQ